MNKIEAKEKFNMINRYNYAQPVQHLWITKEKELYNNRLRKRESKMLETLKKNKWVEKLIYMNHKRKFYKESSITPKMIEKEEEWSEYLI